MSFRLPYDKWNEMPVGYKFGQKTFYDTKHLGVDKGNASWFGTKLKAPTNGKIIAKKIGTEMGLHIHFLDDRGFLWRFGHLLSARDVGSVGAGVEIGEMGNTGLVSPKPTPNNPKAGAHTHTDISKNGILKLNDFNNFIDPLAYVQQRLAENPPMPPDDLNHAFDNKLIRLAPGLDYALVVRGKKYEFPKVFGNPGHLTPEANKALVQNFLAFILILEKTGAVQVPHVTRLEWDSLPVSNGLQF